MKTRIWSVVHYGGVLYSKFPAIVGTYETVEEAIDKVLEDMNAFSKDGWKIDAQYDSTNLPYYDIHYNDIDYGRIAIVSSIIQKT